MMIKKAYSNAKAWSDSPWEYIYVGRCVAHLKGGG